jgi:hypothetical protein
LPAQFAEIEADCTGIIIPSDRCKERLSLPTGIPLLQPDVSQRWAVIARWRMKSHATRISSGPCVTNRWFVAL